MAQYIGYDGNQSAMADEERTNDPQDITNNHTVRQSFSLPMMPSNVPPLMPNQCVPYIHIIEEPTNKTVRFRYECEGRSAGSIPGMNSTATKKTHPTIQICNYNGPVVLVVSCVTVDPPYYQHPHNLICKEVGISCKDGVYSKSLNPNELRFELQKVGIQCVKIKGVVKSLENRRLKKCDPFGAGFSHMADTKKINLNQLRLCYQVFHKVGKKMVPSEPVVSSPIYGKSNELTIVEISSCSSKMSGGDKIIMLCDKVAKNDIRIRFFETNENGEEVWSADGIFESQNVYRQMAITFQTPRYRNPETQDCVKVALELVRDSDKARSDPIEFEYYPNPGTVSQICRENARIKFESVKRKFSENLSPKNKQSRTNQMDTLNVPQNQAPFIHTYQPSAPSPTGFCLPDVKNEQAMFEQYNFSSVSSSPNYGNLTHSPNYGNLTHSPNYGNLPLSPKHGNLPLSPSSSCSGTGFGLESVILQNNQTQPQQLEQQRQEEEQRQQQLLQQLEQQRQEKEQRQQQLLQQLEQQRQEEEQRQQHLLQQQQQQRQEEEQRQQQLLQQQQQWHCPEKHPTCDPNTELMNSLTMLTINFPQTNGDPQRTIQPTNEDHENVELTHLSTTGNVLSLPTTTSIPANNTDNNNALSSNQNFTNPPDYIQYDQLEPPTTEEILLEICNSDFIEQIKNLNPE